MEEKKRILTYTGLKKLEEELENLKVVKRKEVADEKLKKQENRETYQRMQSTMQQKMNSATSKHGSKSWRRF